MRGYTTILDEALEAWAYARRGVIDEIRNFSDDAMTFKPSAGSRSVIELGQQIIASGLLMAGELSHPDGNFRRKPYPELLRKHAGGHETPTSKGALLDALE